MISRRSDARRRLAVVTLLVGVALLIAGVVVATPVLDSWAMPARANGTVVAVAHASGGPQDDREALRWRSTVEFPGSDGAAHRFSTPAGTGERPTWDQGAAVPVAFDPVAPEGAMVVPAPAGIVVGALLALVGALCTTAGAATALGVRHRRLLRSALAGRGGPLPDDGPGPETLSFLGTCILVVGVVPALAGLVSILVSGVGSAAVLAIGLGLVFVLNGAVVWVYARRRQPVEA